MEKEGFLWLRESKPDEQVGPFCCRALPDFSYLISPKVFSCVTLCLTVASLLYLRVNEIIDHEEIDFYNAIGFNLSFLQRGQ